VGKTEGRKE